MPHLHHLYSRLFTSFFSAFTLSINWLGLDTDSRIGVIQLIRLSPSSHNSSSKFPMASILDHIPCPLLILGISLQVLAIAQANYNNVNVSWALYAGHNSTWTSPSGHFAFGFRQLQGEDKFLLAIWFDKIPDKTIVWFATGDYSAGSDYSADSESKVELTRSGLVLQSPGGWTLWRTEIENIKNTEVIQGAMLDNGNFVITNKNSKILWQSFDHPTNTILPTQVLRVGSFLTSTILENSYTRGKFQLLHDGNLTLNQISKFTGNAYKAYSVLAENVTRVVFNVPGASHTTNLSRDFNIMMQGSLVKNRDFYHRATLDFDGTFTLYSHLKTSNGNESWSITQVTPVNICLSMYDSLGAGVCGYNSICERRPDWKPHCSCPLGFTFLDPNNKYGGCKPQDAYHALECNQEGTTVDKDRFDFMIMDGADWPLAAYEKLQLSTLYECRKFCLEDCYCTVAIFQDPKYTSTGIGTCWKKRLPLSNGRWNQTVVDRKALIKVFKSKHQPNPGKDNQNQEILILSVFLGTSVFFNFLCLAAVSLFIFYLLHKRLHYFYQSPAARDLDFNLRSFTYKDLEESTDGFKEELGRGAFGIVYKGVLASRSGNYVAVKKLDKMMQDGEKEFETEVKVIGQTHHKNLVRLLGYCEEGNHRLLVYEFMHNGSLSSYLFGLIRPSWHQRMQIAFGIARGLMYLHEECSTKIIHCDIKPQNILLDDSFTAKISDFGLAKLLINNHTRTITGIRGTKGYVAPEWFRNIPVTSKVDVYSFGIVLLEIICCRKSVELEMEKEAILGDWAYDCYRKGRVENLVEGDVEARSDLKRLEKLVMVAIWCGQDDPLLRPSMRAVTLMLEGVLEVYPPPCPFLFSSVSSTQLQTTS